jgi:hypothetical protein
MAAAAFKGTITMRNIQTGETAVQPFTCTDVANAFALFVNNGLNNFINAPGNKTQTAVITDVSLSAGGTDTSQLNLRASQKDTGINFLNSGVVSTVNNRVPTPIPIVGGSSIMLKQLA